MAPLLPELFLDMWISMMGEEVEIGHFLIFVNRFFGFTTLFGGLLFSVICLIPYRRGEKWAWYAVLVIRGIHLLGILILWTPYAPYTVIFFILWIVGLALPAKEILGKSS